MPGRKIDSVSLDDRNIRVVNEKSGDRVEPNARQRLLEQRGSNGRVVFVMVRITGRPISASSTSHPGLSFCRRLLSSMYRVKKLRPRDFQPRIGVNFAIRTVVILEKRRVSVVERQEPVGHVPLAGKWPGCMGKKERIFAQADHAAPRRSA